MTTLVDQISSFITDLKWAEVPSEMQLHARNRLLDAISTAVASRDVATTKALISAGEALGQDGPCTVLPTGRTASASDAALVNGTAVHAILFEDIHLGSADHPGAVIVPAALAAAEASAALVGREANMEDLLSGILVGYEVHLRLGGIAAKGIQHRKLRTTSMFGTIGAAAAVSRVLRLPHDQVVSTIAMGANMSFGFLEGFAHGTMEPYVQAGIAARQGVLAAHLGRAGVLTGSTVFEGSAGFLQGFADIEPGSATFPDNWRIKEVSCKPYPISGGKIGVTDSSIAISQKGIDPSLIESVVVKLIPGIKEFPGADKPGPFTTINEAQDSTQFCVAAGLLGRDMTSLSTILDEFADPDVEALSHKITLISDPGRTLAYVEVTLTDGTVESAEVDWSKEQIPTVEKMAQKLRHLTVGYWAPEVAESIIDIAAGPTDVPVHELTRVLRT
ncbi:MAG: hypothetical protein JWQ70_2803 [Aeromicrobium sp.]|nr:hypothetical protein [Aeromicrobium sp.]